MEDGYAKRERLAAIKVEKLKNRLDLMHLLYDAFAFFGFIYLCLHYL